MSTLAKNRCKNCNNFVTRARLFAAAFRLQSPTSLAGKPSVCPSVSGTESPQIGPLSWSLDGSWILALGVECPIYRSEATERKWYLWVLWASSQTYWCFRYHYTPCCLAWRSRSLPRAKLQVSVTLSHGFSSSAHFHTAPRKTDWVPWRQETIHCCQRCTGTWIHSVSSPEYETGTLSCRRRTVWRRPVGECWSHRHFCGPWGCQLCLLWGQSWIVLSCGWMICRNYWGTEWTILIKCDCLCECCQDPWCFLAIIGS